MPRVSYCLPSLHSLGGVWEDMDEIRSLYWLRHCKSKDRVSRTRARRVLILHLSMSMELQTAFWTSLKRLGMEQMVLHSETMISLVSESVSDSRITDLKTFCQIRCSRKHSSSFNKASVY